MKRWAAITVILYLLVCVAAIFPLAGVLLFLEWGSIDAYHDLESEGMIFFWIGALDDTDPWPMMIWMQWGGFLWLGVMILSQVLLLLVPLDAARERPISRRRMWAPMFVGSFLFANVVFWTVYSLAVAVFADESFQWGPGEMGILIAWGGIVTILWATWGWLFFQFAKAEKDPMRVTRRVMQWLLRGSILELLVAVPSHILVRQRGDCCAPMLTFWGIMTGVTVMLAAFGPGVFFLFAERVRRLRPRRNDPSDSDMTGAKPDN